MKNLFFFLSALLAGHFAFAAGHTVSISFISPTCYGGTNGSATATVSGGIGPFTYSWAPTGGTNATATGLPAGIYTCTVTDQNDMSVSTGTVNLTQPPAIYVALTATAVTCNASCNGAISAIPSGGNGPYTYYWTIVSATTATITNLCPATYTCVVTDASGCTGANAIAVTQPPAMTISPNITPPSCNSVCDGSINQLVMGGTPPYSYYWPTYNWITSNVGSLCAGSYSCLVTDANGCVFNGNYNLTQPPPVTISLSPSNPSICVGGNVTISATGAVTYTWVPGNIAGSPVTVSPTTTTTYTVTGVNANGCPGTGSVTVVVNPNPTLASGTETPAGCNISDGSADVIAAGGTLPYAFMWNTTPVQNTIQATNLASGMYSCTVTDANGCTASTPVTVTDSCDYVWPGDANDDGIADNTDILDIGIANGATGTTRANASTNWIGQPSTAWGQTLLSGTDYKWVDCDGNGTIQPADTNAVVQNFGFTHNNRLGANPVYNATLPDLAVTMNQQTVTAGTGGTLNISLGTSANPAADVYGLAFTLNFDGTQIDAASFRMNENGTWMGNPGTDLMGVVLTPVTGNNAVQVAITRLNHTDVNGFGPIANMAFMATNDLNGSGNSMNVLFSITDITVLSANENTQQVNIVNDSVTVADSAVVTSMQTIDIANNISVYPNPFNANATIVLPAMYAATANEIVLTDVNGRIVRKENFTGTNYSLDRGKLVSGIYFCSVYANGQRIGMTRLAAE